MGEIFAEYLYRFGFQANEAVTIFLEKSMKSGLSIYVHKEEEWDKEKEKALAAVKENCKKRK